MSEFLVENSSNLSLFLMQRLWNVAQNSLTTFMILLWCFCRLPFLNRLHIMVFRVCFYLKDNSFFYPLWFTRSRKLLFVGLYSLWTSDPYDSHELNKHPLPVRLSLNAHSIQTSSRTVLWERNSVNVQGPSCAGNYPAVNRTRRQAPHGISMAVHDNQTSSLFGISLKEVGSGDGSK